MNDYDGNTWLGEIDLPSISLDECVPGLSRDSGGDLRVYLRVKVADDSDASPPEFLLELGRLRHLPKGEGAVLEGVDPYVVAGALMAAGDSVVRLAAIERGLEAQEAEKLIRKRHRQVKHQRLEEREAVVAVSSCAYCSRPVAVIFTNDEGETVKVCKRHAEELGVRERGKV